MYDGSAGAMPSERLPDQLGAGVRWPGLAADIESLGAVSQDDTGRVAIVSYEFVGVVRNGGIGTACTELGTALAAEGHDVDLVFVGLDPNLDSLDIDRWRRHYWAKGMRLIDLDLRGSSEFDTVIPGAAVSMAVYRRLKELDRARPYDAIHFPESLGQGFFSLLAKRAGLAFDRATTVVGTHSPRRWLAEAHGTAFDQAMLFGDEFLEERSIELADVVVSPSHHMLNWLVDRGVSLPERSYVQQYVTDFEQPDARDDQEAGPVEELVFFGRLEPRKGLVQFCDALDGLAGDAPPERLRRVTFLGKNAMPPGYVEQRAESWPWDVEVISNLDRDAALDYLQGEGRLAIMASSMDNSPNVVYEAIGIGIPFLASRGGGTGELIALEDLERFSYDPYDGRSTAPVAAAPGRNRAAVSAEPLERRLRALLAEDAHQPARFAVTPSESRVEHLAWHRAIVGHGASAAVGQQPAGPVEEVAIGDLTRLAEEGSDLVSVVDSDAELEPGARDALEGAAARRGATAFVTALGRFEVVLPAGAPAPRDGDRFEERVFVPVGGPASVAPTGNVMGTGIVLVRREALRRIYADMAPDMAPRCVAGILTHAILAGEAVDVLPEVLYRLPGSEHMIDSVSRTRDIVEILRPYHMRLPPAAADLADIASRILREEAGLREAAHHAHISSGHLSTVSSELSELRGSRSMRLTQPLRSTGSVLRRLRRRMRT